MSYATRCHRNELKLITATDKLADKAQKFLEEKTIGHKETSPEDMKKLSMDLRPQAQLKKELTLEEQDAWFKEFTSFFKWNKAVLKIQPYDTKRQELHNCISPGLRMELSTDSSKFTAEGHPLPVPIVGDSPDDEKDCLFKLQEYSLAENPIHLRRHNFKNQANS